MEDALFKDLIEDTDEMPLAELEEEELDTEVPEVPAPALSKSGSWSTSFQLGRGVLKLSLLLPSMKGPEACCFVVGGCLLVEKTVAIKIGNRKSNQNTWWSVCCHVLDANENVSITYLHTSLTYIIVSHFITHC